MRSQNLLINKLSQLLQIIPFYYNYRGKRVEISNETKTEIISSMGIEINEDSFNYWIDYFEQNIWKSLTESVYVSGEFPEISIYGNESTQNYLEIEITPYEDLGWEGKKIKLSIDLKEAPIVETKTFGNKTYYKYLISLPQLSIGYYKLRALTKQKESDSFLIIAPSEIFNHFKNKTWGFHINLWSLRGESRESDFSHLRKLVQYVDNLGGFVSINPLHFNDPEDIYGISPYSALSRLFKTPLYVSDVTIEEKNREFFEYKKIWMEKLQKLKNNYLTLHKNPEEFKKFQDFKNNLTNLLREDLKYFAVFCFLREKLGKNWLDWQEKFKNPDKSTLDKIYEENLKDVSFYEYLQWLVEKEIEHLKKYNLCLDLGFGCIKNSFDVWINRVIYALNAEYGAPPDDFNPKGQKWGFPPVIPFKLKNQGYLPFIKVLRANMKSSILRFDHALGLFRAFWIPEGKSPSEGAYVRYPWNDLIAITCLESQINKTSVIGEDLGTAEEWMRDELSKRKISSWKVFYFEKDSSTYKDQSQYPKEALCSITTHDLPTFKGFWQGKDIQLRKQFSIFDESMVTQAYEERIKDKERIVNLLLKCNLLEDRENMESLILSIIKFLSGTETKYLLLYPEDLLLLEEQTNLPGTTTEYPNWQRKLPITVSEILNAPIIKKIETILRETERIPDYF